MKGFIALITILIILGIILITGVSISFLSIKEASMSLQKSQSSQAYYLANLCAEKALMELKDDPGYNGETIPSIENGSCQISVDSVGLDKIVKVSADFQNQTRKMKIKISQINPEMIIDYWFEVAEL